MDIGLLFDPARRLESQICDALIQSLALSMPSYRIRFNEPYLGIDDGLTTYLRTRFDDSDYAGVEIEISQKLISDHEEICRNLITALKKVAN